MQICGSAMWRGNESEYLKLVEKARGKVAADSLRDRAREIVREHRKGVYVDEMNEEQKQAVADAKIKMRNAYIDGFGYDEWGSDILVFWDEAAYDALCLVTPQATESVQNGTADNVYVSYWCG